MKRINNSLYVFIITSAFAAKLCAALVIRLWLFHFSLISFLKNWMVESQVSLLLYWLFLSALKSINIQHVTHFTLIDLLKFTFYWWRNLGTVSKFYIISIVKYVSQKLFWNLNVYYNFQGSNEIEISTNAKQTLNTKRKEYLHDKRHQNLPQTISSFSCDKVRSTWFYYIPRKTNL